MTAGVWSAERAGVGAVLVAATLGLAGGLAGALSLVALMGCWESMIAAIVPPSPARATHRTAATNAGRRRRRPPSATPASVGDSSGSACAAVIGRAKSARVAAEPGAAASYAR